MKAGEEGRQKSISAYLVIFVVITIINAILARFGDIARPIGPGSSGLYVSVAFMITFALWFGGWGVLAAYAGCVIGAGWLGGMPLEVNLYWSLADLWQVVIPFAAFRAFDANVELRTRRDVLIFLVFGWLLNNVVGAGWGASTLAIAGIAPWSGVSGIFIGWLIGNLLVTILITPLLLRCLTPRIRATRLLVEGYWH